MKKLYFFSTIALVLVTLSACQLDEEKTVQGEVNANTVLDNQIFDLATKTNKSESCSEISSADKKQECIDVIDSNLKTIEAVTKGDKKLCKDISLDRYKENCENRVEIALDSANAEKDAKEEDEKLQAEILSIESTAIKNNDANTCNDIKDEGPKYACRYNVLANIALQKGTPSSCNEIGQDSYTAKCQSLFASDNSKPPQN